MSNRIHSKGPYVQEEYKANSALIYPGYLLELDANGEVAPHDSHGGVCEAMFAVEDALQGNAVDTIYADDSIVTCILPCKGACVNAMIEANEDVAIGDALMSNGNGKLVVRSADSALGHDEYIIAFAMEACDCTGSNPADARCSVRVI